MLLRFCLLACAALPLDAQILSSPPVPLPVPRADFMPFYIPRIADAPFTATATLQRGSEKTTARLARDVKGRTRQDMREVIIADPASGTRTVLNVNNLTATISPGITMEPAANRFQPPTGSENLGLATIEGVNVHGYRANNRETWFSDQLQLIIKSRHETAHSINTFTLTQISLNHPDEALFQVPYDYKQIRVKAASFIPHRAEPIYPALALTAHIGGTAEFTATLGPHGLVNNLQLLQGHPLLSSAAIARCWSKSSNTVAYDIPVTFKLLCH